ncbi:MAG: hypothetical protein A2W31_15265 [Planctomycetes bacterium RBG_16_64_10]|nr:MAG: hypothetical protein A2W31_15265 [Planctomycetes bacterium RBG_16_64_10]
MWGEDQDRAVPLLPDEGTGGEASMTMQSHQIETELRHQIGVLHEMERQESVLGYDLSEAISRQRDLITLIRRRWVESVERELGRPAP